MMKSIIAMFCLCALVGTASAAIINDGNWSALISGGSNGVNAEVDAVLIADNGDVYVGGQFTQAGNVPANAIARWDGAAWHALGSGVSNAAGSTKVLALAEMGTNIYVAGQFTMAGGIAATNIACWNGSAWSALGDGLNDLAAKLLVDGTNLYAAGVFTQAGGMPASGVARWDGSSWHALGSGIPVNPMSGEVNALAMYGTNLVAGGFFDTAGGMAATNLAQWNGTAWASFAGGIPSTSVKDLAVDGNNLYACGDFSLSATNAAIAKNVARWDGTAWHALGSGLDRTAYDLVLADSTLFVGGIFTNAGGVAASHIAQWDGSSWSPLGSGMDNPVEALAAQPYRFRVFAGGYFTLAGSNTCNHIAQIENSKAIWTGAVDSQWTNTLNWTDGVVPGPGDLAYFGTSSNYTVNIAGADAVVQGIILDSANQYALNGPNILRPGSGGITVQGWHQIRCTIDLPSNAGSFNISTGSTLTDYNDPITGSGTLTKMGQGDLQISAYNTFAGGTHVVEGTLVVDSDAGFGTSNTVTLAGGELHLGFGFTDSSRTFQLTSSSSMSCYDPVYLNGPLTGTGDLTIYGPMYLNGSNTLDGTVVVTGDIAGIGGTGSLSGNLRIEKGEEILDGITNIYMGTLFPGNSVGTFTVGGSVTNPGIYQCEIDGLAADRLVVGGNLDITGGTLQLHQLGGTPNGTYVIASYGSLSGTFETIEDLPYGYSIDYAYDDGIGSNNIALVPDVASAVLRWPLEAGSGTNITEAVSGTTNVAHTVGTVAWTNGVAPDSAYAVDVSPAVSTNYIDAGTLTTNGSYVAGSDPGYRVLATNWSITAWLTLPAPQSVTGDRVIASSDTGATSDWWTFFLGYKDFFNHEELEFDFANTRVDSGLSVPLDYKVFVAIVGDSSGTAVGGGSNRYRFYLWDGSGWQSASGTAFIPIRLQGLEIGSFNDGTRPFDGRIDDLRIYDRSLTQAELDNLVTYPAGSYEAYTLGLGLGLNGTNADFNFDYDHDGIPNGFEWATYTSATNPADAVRLTITNPYNDDSRFINFARNSDSYGITYWIQRSDDLADPNSWSNQVYYVDGSGWSPVGPADYTDLSTQDTQPARQSIGFPTTNGAAFYRLYMTHP